MCIRDSYGKDADKHWSEVMKLAEQYGFILQAAGGTAFLATHRNQLETMVNQNIYVYSRWMAIAQKIVDMMAV